VGEQVDVHVEFPQFPMSSEHGAQALALFAELWSKPELPAAMLSRDGITVRRVFVGTSSLPLTWEVRLKFQLPVPDRERLRLGAHIDDKIGRENGRWAKDYRGVAVLSVEESNFCLGLHQTYLEQLLAPDKQHAFSTIISTLAYFCDASTPGARFRMEEISSVSRTPGVGLELGAETFGENLKSFGEGHALMTFYPKYAEEEWRLTAGAPPENVYGVPIRQLSIQRRIARLPVSKDLSQMSNAERETLVTSLLERVQS
jgi:hypothetical protein